MSRGPERTLGGFPEPRDRGPRALRGGRSGTSESRESLRVRGATSPERPGPGSREARAGFGGKGERQWEPRPRAPGWSPPASPAAPPPPAPGAGLLGAGLGGAGGRTPGAGRGAGAAARWGLRAHPGSAERTPRRPPPRLPRGRPWRRRKPSPARPPAARRFRPQQRSCGGGARSAPRPRPPAPPNEAPPQGGPAPSDTGAGASHVRRDPAL